MNRQIFLNHIAQTSQFPMGLEVSRAEGIYIYNTKDRPFIDMISGIGVSALGHRHPVVTRALHNQLDQHLHVMVYGEFVQTPQVKAATALIKTLPKNLDNIFFVNSGSEACEGALKLAKRFTGQSKILYCHQAYHGATHGALSVSGSELFKQNFRPLLPDVYPIPFGCIGCLQEITNDTAAIIMETVQGEAGVRLASTSYFKALRKKCNETGTLLILDEIQCGAGRTGHFWAFENYGIVPDILLTAKGIGGGMPAGAFISSKEIMQALTEKPILGHITTFGGHPMSCTAIAATIDTLLEEKLIDTVKHKATLIKTKLQHPEILEIRNAGLLMCLQLNSFKKVQKVIQYCLDNGLITDWFLFCNTAIRIAPPLIISEQEINQACDIIMQALDEAAKI